MLINREKCNANKGTIGFWRISYSSYLHYPYQTLQVILYHCMKIILTQNNKDIALQLEMTLCKC